VQEDEEPLGSNDVHASVDEIGVDFVTKSILTEEQTKVQMQIWDTSSRPDCLRHLGQTFFNGINAVVFCFNVSDKSSLEGLSAWHDRIFSRILKVTGRNCSVVLACKLDEPGEVAGLRGLGQAGGRALDGEERFSLSQQGSPPKDGRGSGGEEAW
jgi:GTPase SAR1 family protein